MGNVTMRDHEKEETMVYCKNMSDITLSHILKHTNCKKITTVRLPLLFIFVIKYIIQNDLPIGDNTKSKNSFICNFNGHEFEVELVCLTRRTISTE